MKKIIKPFIKLIIIILSFFDKIIVTPITKLLLKISEFIKNNSKYVEKALTNKQSLIVISLILAILTFYIVDRKTTTLIDSAAEILYSQPVSAIYNEEAYVVEGLPKTVDITLIGRKSDIYLAKQYPTQEISVDLRELKTGSHKVTLKYQKSVSSLEYKLDPSTASIVIYEKVSETRELTYDILHKDSLDTKLDISNITLDRSNVVIKGAEYKLATVATVKALIDINNLPSQKVGELTLKDISLVAYDAEGKIVDVEIVPEKITAKVTIISPSKTIPIKVIPEGEVSFGKSIESATSSITTITVYGDQTAVDAIEFLPVKVDVNGLDSNKTFNINLTKPNGIRELEVNTITVKITLDTVSTIEVKDVQILLRNLGSKYKVTALSEEDAKVVVVVKGSDALLKKIDTTTIRAYIDLSNYSVGEHEIEVQVEGDDLKLTYTSKTKKIKIRISEK